MFCPTRCWCREREDERHDGNQGLEDDKAFIKHTLSECLNIAKRMIQPAEPGLHGDQAICEAARLQADATRCEEQTAAYELELQRIHSSGKSMNQIMSTLRCVSSRSAQSDA